MTIIVQIVFENWPVFSLIILALIVVLAWLTWKAHVNKVSTGSEGLVGEEGIYKGSDLVQVHGELWKIDPDHDLEKGDVVEVTAVHNLSLSVIKRS
jgi:membrane protein implicated in regulation of membrane protease activity